MLKRIRIKGFKSLEDVEVELAPLTVLFGPNASGKSNFLDALQILSRLATSKSLLDAFAPPYRGRPLESFSFGKQGLPGLRNQDEVKFSIEADIHLSDWVVNKINHPENGSEQPINGTKNKIIARDLRYRLDIAMLPNSGELILKHEHLDVFNPQVVAERQDSVNDDAIQAAIRESGITRPLISYDEHGHFHVVGDYGGHGNIFLLPSMPSNLPSFFSTQHSVAEFPHIEAARLEITSWKFHYFEPRECMRVPGPVQQVWLPGFKGEELAASLNALRHQSPRQFATIEKALHATIPEIDGIKVEVNHHGDVELHFIERGMEFSARMVSDGTLRMLGLLALASAKDASTLIGIEEPENGVHPRRIETVAELLKTQKTLGRSQYIVTTHSPRLLDLLPPECLRVVRRLEGRTHIDPFQEWGPIGKKQPMDAGIKHRSKGLPISERILRGDFDA